MRYLLIILGLVVFLGAVTYMVNRDRGSALAPVMPSIVLLGGLAVIAGMATCEVVEAIREAGRSRTGAARSD
jgi:hypothetical protein